MKEFEDLVKGFQKMKVDSMKNLEKLKSIDPVLFNQIAKDLSVLETTKDINEIQKIQQKYASIHP